MNSNPLEHLDPNTQTLCSDNAIISMDNWEQIIACKKRFLENGENPLTAPFMRREVAESWIRSHTAGVNPYSPKLGTNVTASQLQSILKKINY